MDKFEEWMTKAFEAAEKGDLERATLYKQLAATYAEYKDATPIETVVQNAVTLEVADAVQRLTKLEWSDKVAALRADIDATTDRLAATKRTADAAYYNVGTLMQK